ncbi:MAG: low molecular weight phosphatase family protein [Puniceicoccales bacterium]
MAAQADVLETLQPKVIEVTSEFDQIPAERQRELKKIALFVRSKVKAGEEPQLTFICTHNSRRSHLSQVWAQTAAAYYGVPGVKTYSGGTEATACNERTVRAMRRAGFSIANSTPGEKNPHYLIQYSEDAAPVEAFSKKYFEDGNPDEDFIAVMTCDHADQNCPIVEGSLMRVAIPYVDPKVSDGTDVENATYDERCHQIAREMFYLMSQVNA